MAVTFDRYDLQFILQQIRMAEYGQGPVNPHLAFGLRQVKGTNNNVTDGGEFFGAVDEPFPTFATALYLPNYDPRVIPNFATGPGAPTLEVQFDASPRIISNNIVDQGPANMAVLLSYFTPLGHRDATDPLKFVFDTTAVDKDGIALFDTSGATPVVNAAAFGGHAAEIIMADPDVTGQFIANRHSTATIELPNATPDGGISAPFNTWFTLFGQFFDHGLDMVAKNGKDLVFIANGDGSFTVLSRTLKDASGHATNLVTPFVDNNQTYTSHPSHQVFLREFAVTADGFDAVDGLPKVKLATTGRLLESTVSTATDPHLPTWADVKANALKLGIKLTDADVGNVPLLATDDYGNLIVGKHGFAQVVVLLADGKTTKLVEGTTAGLDLLHPTADAAEVTLRTGHAFINDMARAANPFDDFGNLRTTYDHALLDAHYIGGDGRANENIGLTTVHEIFHNEHNRLVAQIQKQISDALFAGDMSSAIDWLKPGAIPQNAVGFDPHSLDTDNGGDGIIDAQYWNGDRLFQAGKFGTETQYQHLVFEEFARKVVPTIHVAGDTRIHLDPAILSEFANAVYRFGHSMLNETLPTGTDKTVTLLDAFTAPDKFKTFGAADIINGVTAQAGNEIDEFVTGTLRNTLLGMPQDLAALNIARGRDAGVPTLNAFRNEIYSQTHDANLRPYQSWDDFRHYLKHDASIYNFVAAYGNFEDIKAATSFDDKQRIAFKVVEVGSDIANATKDKTTFERRAWDFMHSTGDYADRNLNDETQKHDSRLLQAIVLDANGAVVTNADGSAKVDTAKWSTGSITGLDSVDMWVGGLAEKQALNGSLLGSTFELIFRVQMENLQDADRLYYLPRVEGMQYSDQIENSSFAELVMANAPGTRHLPASIFMTMEYTVEADDLYAKDPNGSYVMVNGQHVWKPASDKGWQTFIGPDGKVHPLVEVLGGTALADPLTVTLSNGSTLTLDKGTVVGGTLHFIGEDNYFGNTMVLGGTSADDKLLAGNADDDTVWADAGNDTADGGGGNDIIYGGDGNDLITDQAADNVAHGDAGNDTILMGKGADIIFGGDGNDWIEGGGGIDDIVGGRGNDIIYGGEGGEEIQGDEGDDWIVGGGIAPSRFGGTDGGDVLFGDVGAPTGQLPLYTGNDVLIGGVGTVMKGFGGDDVMVGYGGFLKFEGGTGFDWASFELETQAVSADMTRRELVSPINPFGGDGIRDVFTHTEGLSGSKFDDNLRGEDTNKVARILAKDGLYDPNLIIGLADTPPDAAGLTYKQVGNTLEGSFFAPGTTDPRSAYGFAAGDIILGGGGNDHLEGGGGDDIIDGDAYLHVSLVQSPTGWEIRREIKYETAKAVDTAVYADASSNYTIRVKVKGDTNLNNFTTVTGDQLGQVLTDGTHELWRDAEGFFTITHNFKVANGGGGGGAAAAPKTIDEGTDLLRNIERLQFSDGTVDVSGGRNALPSVLIKGNERNFAATGGTTAGSLLTSTHVINDADGFKSAISYQWQYQDLLRGEWIDIAGATNPDSFRPGDWLVGHSIRVKATYLDGQDYQETVYSLALGATQVGATGTLLLADPTKNFGPTQSTVGGITADFPDLHLFEGESLNVFIQVPAFFADDHTASTALHYRIVTPAGVTATPFSAGGVVVGYVLTGRPTDITTNGRAKVTILATDDAFGGKPALTAEADFYIDVMNKKAPVAGQADSAPTAAAAPTPAEVRAAVDPIGVSYDRVDLDWILQQIKTAEAGQGPINPHVAFGLRTVSAQDNSAVPGQSSFGQSDQIFPRLITPVFTGDYANTAPGNFVIDNDARLVSNLIADQSSRNPAAKAAAISQSTVMPAVVDPLKTDPTIVGTDHGADNYFIPNVTPDGGISAPFNTFFTLFGQFFDHGLDLLNKGGGVVQIGVVDQSDPLFVTGGPNAMFLSRGLNDGSQNTTNAVTPPVDLSQVYSSHPSHQVFLREYTFTTGANGSVTIRATGRMLEDVQIVNGVEVRHLPTWKDIKDNALKLGIKLTDADVNNIPELLTDAYGAFVRGAHGFAQVKVKLADGTVTYVEGTAAGLDLTNPLPAATGETVSRTGIAFINDKSQNPATLDSHYVAGDGRVNENIGLTAIHELFLKEHNRLTTQIKLQVQQALNAGDTAFASEWLTPEAVARFSVAGVNLATFQIAATEWNGERVFQAARFGAETEYQHLVFEEFARKVAPDIHVAGDTNIHLNPAIFAEFAHTVYRFGHSMLDESLGRVKFNTDGTVSDDPIALMTAFTNPQAFADAGGNAAAGLILGGINQVANEIDEFVTGTLRDNLLGLPMDLAALNIARGRSEGVPGLNLARNEIYSQNHDASLKPYESWHEFGQFLKHYESLVNFVAAYGTEIKGSSTAADTLRTLAGYVVAAGEAETSKGSAKALELQTAHLKTYGDAYDYMHSLGFWKNDTTSALALHDASGKVPLYATGSVTGLDAIDFWIGGLAEKQNLHGGLLGTTFDFVFKLQMENLQDGDRLYYLPRIEGMQYSDQIEGNSFAEIIMANTGLKHLPANVFLTPEYTIEAKDFYVAGTGPGGFLYDAEGRHVWNLDTLAKVTFKGADGLDHPLVEVVGAVSEVDGNGNTILAGGTLKFLGEDNFFGNTMVLGGTASADNLMAGQADDDTIWADEGNDTLDGGGGNDVLYGGEGNDLLSNSNSSIGSVFHGDGGNDTVYGSKGDDAIFGGAGDDWLYGGQGVDDIIGGVGNDVIYGGEGGEEIQGDEGDDWIDGGLDGGDVLFGDVGAPTGQFPLYAGDDVLIGGVGTVMKGFAGDDIMLGFGGFTKFDGGTGFDWASFENEVQGVDIDMSRREFIPNAPAGGDGVRDTYQLTEGASGSRFDDIIKGDNLAKVGVVPAKNELDNPTLIKGLADGAMNGANPVLSVVKGATVVTGTLGNNATLTSAQLQGGTIEGAFFTPGQPTGDTTTGAGFSGGNILLGGAGNDMIQGGSGNDVIDGDAWLHVALLPAAPGGSSQILREILYDTTVGNVDTAVFTDVRTNYDITGPDAEGFITVTHKPQGVNGVLQVGDGVDRIRNIERLKFADKTIAIDQLGNEITAFSANFDSVATSFGGASVDGAAVSVTAAPVVNAPLRVAINVEDRDGFTTTKNAAGADVVAVKVQWQYQDVASGIWVDIADPNDANPLLTSTHATDVVQAVVAANSPIRFSATADFLPPDFFVGDALRAKVSYTDAKGYTEVLYSGATPLLVEAPGINTAPFVVQQNELVGMPNTATQVGKPIQNLFVPLTTIFNDRETAPAALTYKMAVVTPDGVAHDITGKTFMGLTFSVTPDAFGKIVGTPSNLDGSNYTGAMTLRITAIDPQGLSATNDFTLDVVPNAANNPPKFAAPVFHGNATANQPDFYENVAAPGVAVDPAKQDRTAKTTVIADLTVTDQLAVSQSATPISWKIANAANFTVGGSALFSLDAAAVDSVTAGVATSTNHLSFAQAPNFETLWRQYGLAPNADVTLVGGFGNSKPLQIVFHVQVQASDGDVTVTQTEDVIVENVDEKSTGNVRISGATVANGVATLTAVDTLKDVDLVSFTGTDATSVKWQAWSAGAWQAPGASGLTLATSASGIFRATAFYSDPFGTHDSTDAATVSAEIYDVGSGVILASSVPAAAFEGRAHNLTFVGLTARDTISYAGLNTAVSVDLAVGGSGGAAGDHYISIENVQGTSLADTLKGDAGANILIGGGGNDTITGVGGNDTAQFTGGVAQYQFSYVGAGQAKAGDLVAGRDGTDSLAAINAVAFSDSSFALIVNDTAVNRITNTASGTAATLFVGGDNANSIRGGSGNDVFFGGGGNDTVDGNGGSDAAGYHNGVASYVFTFLGTNQLQVKDNTTANAAVGIVNDGTDNILNIGTLRFTDGAFNVVAQNGTTIAGTAGNDIIVGGNTASSITGGTGNDILAGGAGADRFIFNKGSAVDHITDFVTAGTGHDFIDLSTAMGVTNATQAIASASVSNGHVILTLGADVIHLDNVATVGALIADDFRFH